MVVYSGSTWTSVILIHLGVVRRGFSHGSPKLLLGVVSYYAISGVDQWESLSPILGTGVNPFPSRFIYRTPPLGDSALPQLNVKANQNKAISTSREI